MTIERYKLKLKHVSGRDQKLIEAVNSYLPALGLSDSFERGVKESVSTHVGEEFSFRMEMLKLENYSEFCSRLPAVSVMAIIGMAPLVEKAILEIDTPLAIMAIERILGGRGEIMPEARILSDTEQGVLQYLLLQVLAGIHRICGGSERVHFRFERFAFKSHEVRNLAAEDAKAAVAVFRANLGRFSGFVRVVLANPFVEEVFLNTTSPLEARTAENAWRKKQLERFSYIQAPLRAEAGRTTVTALELEELEEGDVILFDNSQTFIVDGRASGSAILRIGEGLAGGFDVNVSVDDKKVHCRINGVCKS